MNNDWLTFNSTLEAFLILVSQVHKNFSHTNDIYFDFQWHKFKADNKYPTSLCYRYTCLVKMRGVIRSKGYLMRALRDVRGKRAFWPLSPDQDIAEPWPGHRRVLIGNWLSHKFYNVYVTKPTIASNQSLCNAMQFSTGRWFVLLIWHANWNELFPCTYIVLMRKGAPLWTWALAPNRIT